MHKKTNNKGTKSERTFSSNAIRLSVKELLITAVAMIIIVLFLFPTVWRGAENLEMSEDFRLAYNYRDDYWVYEKSVDEAMKKHPVVFIGDSVIWGMYVDNQHTLPAIINKKLHKQIVANLAIDGLHSVAMTGLIRYYGSAIKNKTVFIYFNPLWMSSTKYDLSDTEEMDVHHPRLIPQFSTDLQCYQEPLSTRMGVLLERNLPFYSLLNHIRLSFFDNEDFTQWIIDNPYENPVAKISFKLDPIEKDHTNSSKNWSDKGIPEQDWDWVILNKSRQWKSFRDSLKLLKSRNNQICVMIGHINPYILTEASLKKYNELNQAIIKELKSDNIEYAMMPKLSSKEYADASHPLAKGYEVMADKLLKNPLLSKYLTTTIASE